MIQRCGFFVIRLDNEVIQINGLYDPIYDNIQLVLKAEYLTDEDIRTVYNNWGKEFQDKIEYLSGKVSSSVSSSTTCLLCGENPGSKLEKAKQLGIKIITEEEFNKWTLGHI